MYQCQIDGMERSPTTEPWTLETLTRLCARVLAASGVGQRSGRVGTTPSARDIRYYATLGVVDRPSSFIGRTALYSRRHLLQLVALKRLQAEGHSLAEIQARLLGLPDRALEQLARLPDPLPLEPIPPGPSPESLPHTPELQVPASAAPQAADHAFAFDREQPRSVQAPPVARSRGAFWARPPAPAPSPAPSPASPAPPSAPPQSLAPDALQFAPRALQELVLAPGVRLQLEGIAPLSSAEVERLQTAAAPLIVLIRQLTAPDQEMP